MRLFGYPYNTDLVICKDSSDYPLSEHAILVKVVLRESLLEAVLFYRIPRLLLSLVYLDIKYNFFILSYENMSYEILILGHF